MKETKTLHFHRPSLSGKLAVPGDKSISHRAIMLAAIAKGKSTVTGFLDGEDCLRTISIFQQLGVSIDQRGTTVLIDSPGIANWKTPTSELYAGNSGTTARLLLGVLAGSKITATLTGDESLTTRPMGRVADPLRLMDASIESQQQDNRLPLEVTGKQLTSLDYDNKVASAQVKSAILFAGLHTEGKTSVQEDVVSRDHTERMLQHFGASITMKNGKVSVAGGVTLQGTDVHVPGDISSAAFFMAAAAMIQGSQVKFTDVGLNPTRTGVLDVLTSMGASVTTTDEQVEGGEPSGTVVVSGRPLTGIEISGSLIPRLIDELPIIALLATQAEGTTIIKDAAELRVKETDRIHAVTSELSKIGASIEATADGMIIKGPTPLTGGTMSSYGDHRLGMMAAIAALLTSEPVTIEDTVCIGISYPTFFQDLAQLVSGKV